jgi:dynein heavy chain
LWDVQPDDEIVVKAKALIAETVKENLEMVKLAVKVYDDYLFILQEKERVDAFLARPGEQFERGAFQAELDKYAATITKIRDEAPFEIRMNMFLIRCGDINNALCDECESLMDTILNRVGDHVFVTLAPEISQSVKAIQEELGLKSQQSNDLVSHEQRLEAVRNSEHKRLTATYADMMDWFMFLNENPKYKMLDDTAKPILQAFKSMGWIPSSIEKAETKLRNERTDIENALMEQTRRFQAKIDETKAAVYAFKDNSNQRKAANYVEGIDEINKTLKYLVEERGRIAAQQADLEMMPGEYALLDKEDSGSLFAYIKPFEELWRLNVEFADKMKAWEGHHLSTLSPDDIEADFKKMQSGATKLLAKFEGAKPALSKPATVASTMKDKLMKFRPNMPVIRALCNPGLMDRHR